MTITEALAELKTLGKRITTKQQYVLTYLARQNTLKDPLEKEDGGSAGEITRTMQSISDLEERVVAIRRGIAQANSVTTITIGDKTRTIAEWLTWRREIAEGHRGLLVNIANKLENLRQQAQAKGLRIADTEVATDPTDVIVNINEAQLARDIEALDETLGTLDGQLSLKNATVSVALSD